MPVCRLLSVLLFACLLSAGQSVCQGEEGQWRSLFNGKDLTGWTPKIKGSPSGENYGDTFRVQDGLLQVRYDKYSDFGNRFGHLFYKDSFSHYRLRVEYRFVGEQCPGGPVWAIRNSGAMLHGQSPESMSVEQDFPVSIEAQLLGGDGKSPRTTGNLCTPGTNVVMNGELITRHCTSAKSKTFVGDQWVVAEFEVRGDQSIKHFINGELVLEYTTPQYDDRDADAKKLIDQAGGKKSLPRGTISLQSESHPIDFRKVEILILSPDAPK